MSIEFHFAPETNCLYVRGDLTIYTIAEAKIAMELHKGIRLDLAKVLEVDGAGLQLLMALKRDAQISIAVASAAVADMLRLTGQTGLLAEEGTL